MGRTYFRRYRMGCDLATALVTPVDLPPGYRAAGFDDKTIRHHAAVKSDAFADGLDAFVFHCLSRPEGCLRLMREIASRDAFCPESTWLIWHDQTPVGTVQGLIIDGVGNIQNLAVARHHRGRGLGRSLLQMAAGGFRRCGADQMQLEVTADNFGAVRLYQRLGLTVDEVVYKSAEVAGAEIG